MTLTDVCAAVGLNRGVALYHFHSRAEVLIALLEPFVADLEALLDRFESAPGQPVPAILRRAFAAWSP